MRLPDSESDFFISSRIFYRNFLGVGFFYPTPPKKLQVLATPTPQPWLVSAKPWMGIWQACNQGVQGGNCSPHSKNFQVNQSFDVYSQRIPSVRYNETALRNLSYFNFWSNLIKAVWFTNCPSLIKRCVWLNYHFKWIDSSVAWQGLGNLEI